MAIIPGSVVVTGTIAPTDSQDIFATIDPLYGIDGLRNVADKTERNDIPLERQRLGMLVGTQDDGKYWKLVALGTRPMGSTFGTDDVDWDEFSSGISDHETLSNLMGGATSGHYHSDQPINTTDDVLFQRIVSGNLEDGAAWDFGYLSGGYRSNAVGYRISSDSNGASLAGLKARGTYPSSLSAIQNGDTIFNFRASGYTGASFRINSVAGIGIKADENWTALTQGTRINFYIIKPNDAINNFEAMTIRSDAVIDIAEVIKIGNTTVTPENGMIRFDGLKFQGYKAGSWYNLDEQVGSILLDDLSDVSISSTSLSDGDVLTYDSISGDWINSVPTPWATGVGTGSAYMNNSTGNTADLDYSISAGDGAVANDSRSFNFSSSPFSGTERSGYGFTVMQIDTVDDTQTFLSNGDQLHLNIEQDHSYLYKLRILVRDDAGNSATYEDIVFIISDVSGTPTTRFDAEGIFSAAITTSNGDAALATCELIAQINGNVLEFLVTGIAATNIHWTAFIEWIKCGYVVPTP